MEHNQQFVGIAATARRSAADALGFQAPPQPASAGGRSRKCVRRPAPPQRTCALRILLAATIFMALVIFWMLATDFMRCFTAARARRGREPKARAGQRSEGGAARGELWQRPGAPSRRRCECTVHIMAIASNPDGR